ncbi:CpaF family protein [Ruminococcus gauvreauii]|uniref:CpaF family protein n=1 Tax=Ruminococcus gauvreauii TaxID=438033 RepID=A0ABY5VK62_9FIRM|nr:CpaF family protein [Ruminococcus gauvreauii]UWP60697.1 CpaF family protein [Ruminococcus gauvreauii]
MKHFETLHRELMALLETSPELSDGQILELIDGLLVDSETGRCLSLREKDGLRDELFCSVRRLDVLQELIDDPQVTEIMVNGCHNIFVERDGRITRFEKNFTAPEKLEDVIQQIVGKCNRIINESRPIVDARLDNGARVNAVVEPVSLDGPALTIRRFPDVPITMETLIAWGSITREAAGFLRDLVKSGYSILVGGGTSAGKTTFLNALSNYIPGDERVITIEDTAELQIQGVENLVRLEARTANLEGGKSITIRDLIRTALRMRPDRIIVGEVRSEEAIDLLQAWNTGHEGSIGTAHANSSRDMVSRLETMVLMGMQLPLEAIRRQIASGIDVMIHIGKTKKKQRKVMEICEVTGLCGGEVQLRPLYRWDDEMQQLEAKERLKNTEKLERMMRYEAGL